MGDSLQGCSANNLLELEVEVVNEVEVVIEAEVDVETRPQS